MGTVIEGFTGGSEVNTTGVQTVTIAETVPEEDGVSNVMAQYCGFTSGGNALAGSFSVGVKNEGGTISFLGSPVALAQQADLALITATISFDESGGVVRMRATGVLAQTIKWFGAMSRVGRFD